MFRKAILIIHGFGGWVYDEEYLSTNLEFIKNYDVFTFTLPGHDGFPGKYTRFDWINSAEKQIENLINHGYKNIYLVGHSMGGVISTYISSKYKEVKKLVLAAPAFHYLKFKNDKPDIIESIIFSPEVIKEYKADVIFSRWFNLPKQVYVPTLIIHGTRDNLVPSSSVNYVYNNLSSNYKELLEVKGINHDIFRSDRKEVVTNLIIKFFKSNCNKKYSEIKKI